MDLRDSSLGFYRAWHIALGARHGLFIALRDGPIAPGTLAAELGLDARAVDRWCRGAHALGLLTRDAAERYRLAASHADSLGEPTSIEYLGHHFEYITRKSLTFGGLDDTLHGKRSAVRLAPTYAVATRWDHLAFFEDVLARQPALRRELESGADVLDLGAGEGGWVREAATRFPRSRFTVADLDTRPLRRLRDVRVVHARRVPAAAFDVVHMGEVLAATEDPAAVLRAAHRALRPGGRLVAMEGLRPPDERAPRGWGERLVAAMGLDFSMDGSRYLSREEVFAAARDAGFTDVRVRDVGGSLFCLTARKPQTAAARRRSG